MHVYSTDSYLESTVYVDIMVVVQLAVTVSHQLNIAQLHKICAIINTLRFLLSVRVRPSVCDGCGRGFSLKLSLAPASRLGR